MKFSESIANIAPALAKAQAAMAAAVKDANNPAFGSKYADLASVVDAIKPALTANGISYIQSPVTTDKDEVGIETLLLHSSGEYILSEPWFLPVAKANAHGFGSALTYCRRYALAAVCGLKADDDDGNAAATATPAKRPNTATEVAVDAFDSMPEDEKKFLQEHATVLIDMSDHAAGDESHVAMWKYVEAQNFDTEEKLAIWALLPSKVRSGIKKGQKLATPLAEQA